MPPSHSSISQFQSCSFLHIYAHIGLLVILHTISNVENNRNGFRSFLFLKSKGVLDTSRQHILL
jgi:hypothetical protein